MGDYRNVFEKKAMINLKDGKEIKFDIVTRKLCVDELTK